MLSVVNLLVRSDRLHSWRHHPGPHWHQRVGPAQCIPLRLPLCLRPRRHCIPAEPVSAKLSPFKQETALTK